MFIIVIVLEADSRGHIIDKLALAPCFKKYYSLFYHYEIFVIGFNAK